MLSYTYAATESSGLSCPPSEIADFSRFTNGQGRASVSGPNGQEPFFCLGAVASSVLLCISVAVKEM